MNYIYSSDKQFNQEKEKIFRDLWIFFGFTNEFDGKINTVEKTISGFPVVLVKSNEGYKGYLNICPHRGMKIISENCRTRKSIVCPYHSLAFNVNDGRCINYTAKDFDCSNNETINLQELNVVSVGSFIFIKINNNGVSIDSQLGEYMDVLMNYSRLMDFENYEKKEIPHDCNWKFIVENVIDNKHCTPVHSKTLGSMGYCFEKPEVKFDEYNSLFKIPTEPRNRSESKKIKLLKKMFRNSNVEAPYTHYLIFPNLTLSVFNGSLLTIGNIRPLNSKSSIYETHYLLPKVGQETNRVLLNSIKENHVKSAIQIFEEDRLMLNKLSNHLEIINKPGFHFKEETRIHHFHKVYTKAINM